MRCLAGLLVLGLFAGEAFAQSKRAGDPVSIRPGFRDVTPQADHANILGTSTFPLRAGGVMTVAHIPTGYDSPPGSVWIASRVTTDEGKSWSDEREIVRHKDCQASHPTELRTRDGVIHVFYLGYKKHSWTNGEPNPDDVSDLWTVRTSDDGVSWTKPQKIFAGYTGATNGGIETSSGRLIVPFSHYVPKPGHLVSRTVVSDDGGKTWRQSSIIDIGGAGDHEGAVEPAVVELKDGRIWMLIRTSRGNFWQSYSTDGGTTWSQAKPTAIGAAHAPGHVIRLASGRLALAWNQKEPGRRELYIALSKDDAKTWDKPVLIASGRQVCYPFIAERSPGVLWIGFVDASRGWNTVASRIVSIEERELLSRAEEK